MSAAAKLLAAALLGAALVLTGCAVPAPAPLDAAQVSASERGVREGVRQLRARLFRISYSLRVGARRLCEPLLLPDAGVLLAAADPSRPSPAGLSVLYVVPGSPLARAGVREGDVVLDLDGQSAVQVSQFNIALPAVRPAELTLQRGVEHVHIRAELARACAVPVELSEDTGIMTFQRGSSVAVPYGLLEAASDDWLAIAIAHQIAHALLEFATERIDDPEAVADRLGLLLAAEAGFDVSTAPDFWRWLAHENPWRIARTGAFRIRRPGPSLETEIEYSAAQLHLGIARRLPAIRASVEEILAARSRAR